MFLIIEPDFKSSAKDMQKFLAFVSVRFAAASAGLDAKQVRLHDGIAPSEQLHAHAGTGFQNFAIGGADEPGIFSHYFEKRNNIGFIKTRDAAQGGDGGAHLSALEGAEKPDGYASGACDLGKGKATMHAQTAKALSGDRGSFRRSGDDSLFFQDMDDGRRVESSGAAQKNRALEQADIGFGVLAIAAEGALWSHEA